MSTGEFIPTQYYEDSLSLQIGSCAYCGNRVEELPCAACGGSQLKAKP